MKINIKHISVLLLAVIFVSCGRGEQKAKKNEETEVEKLSRTDRIFKKADSLSFISEYDKSNLLILPEIHDLYYKKDYKNYIDAVNMAAANFRKLGNYDSAFTYCGKIVDSLARFPDSTNLSIAQTYYLLGLMYRDYGITKEASEYLNKSLQIRSELLPKNDPLIGDIYNNIAIVSQIKGELDNAEKYFRLALELRKQRGFYDKSVASTYMNLGTIFYDKREYTLSFNYLDTAMTIQRKILGDYHPAIASILTNIGNTLSEIGKLDSSIVAYNKAVEILKKTFGDNHPLIAKIYNNIGVGYSFLNDYNSAITFFERSIQIKEKLNSKLGNDYYDNYLNLGIVYQSLNDQQKTIEYYSKAMEIGDKLFPGTPISAQIKSMMIEPLLDSGEISAARKYYYDIMRIFQNSAEVDSFSFFKSRTQLSNILLAEENFIAAIKNTSDCLKYFKSIDELNWILFCYELLATANLGDKDYTEVGRLYEETKEYFTGENNKFDVGKIAAYQRIYRMYNLILNMTGNAFYNQYIEAGDVANLDKCKEVYENMIELFQKNYSIILSESSKIAGSSKIKEYLGTAIESAVMNYKLNPTNENYEFALKIAEFGKSLTLLEKLDKNTAMELSNIPAGYAADVSSLQKQIFNINSIISKENVTELSREKKEILEAELLDKRFELQQIERLLREKYPLYKEITEFKIDISVEDITSNIIDPDQTAVEFYIHGKKLYSFIISESSKEIIVNSLPDDFENKIQSFLSSITSIDDPDIFAQKSYDIYKTVFAETDLLIDTHRLLIINDGFLGYVPFDALIYELPAGVINYKTMPYLINKLSIGYAYSFNVLSKSTRGRQYISTFLGIAPFSSVEN
ncbi:MAG: tetratricopeptide repeat protein [Melioribacteraceae bacterium]|nr:tetratricopeptide repeat protein [Melioribacteraceae bacterium]MCF8355236.1 tetratricopeptide repeat protein [Melioribacteraceae bacterium]MCF8395223.1 tetratricopeptide repeat protein [Melioribacteraceae bacterium]MCF8420697.1 tetratricopeptide repeat protein [Melioribacteraceae bacterium]